MSEKMDWLDWLQVAVVVLGALAIIFVFSSDYYFQKGIKSGRDQRRTENEIAAYREGYDDGAAARKASTQKFLLLTNSTGQKK